MIRGLRVVDNAGFGVSFQRFSPKIHLATICHEINYLESQWQKSRKLLRPFALIAAEAEDASAQGID
jgi:hypothetical protein